MSSMIPEEGAETLNVVVRQSMSGLVPLAGRPIEKMIKEIEEIRTYKCADCLKQVSKLGSSAETLNEHEPIICGDCGSTSIQVSLTRVAGMVS